MRKRRPRTMASYQNRHPATMEEARQRLLSALLKDPMRLPVGDAAREAYERDLRLEALDEET